MFMNKGVMNRLHAVLGTKEGQFSLLVINNNLE